MMGGETAGKAGALPMPVGGAGGRSDVGSGGTPANMAPTTSAVRGTLIDVRRRPLANVMLHVGDQTATTDDVGKFSVDNVSATYDVSFKLTTIVRQMPTTYAWRFEGLTRRDPTLQVYKAAEQQLTGLTWHNEGATFPLQADQRILAGFGSPDGDFSAGVNTAEYESPVCYWSGPASTLGVTHGLLFTVSGPEELPLEYLAHDAKPLTLTTGTDAVATFNLATTKPPSGAVTGRVNAPGTGDRSNWIILRWTDGTAFTLAIDTAATDTFSYLIPTITEASTTIIAARVCNYAGGLCALAYADNLSPRQTDVQLDIPLPPTLSSPGEGTTRVDAMTTFQWTGDAKLFVFAAKTKESMGYDAMYVVTSKKETRLPVGTATSYTPPVGTQFEWHVETHGDYASVDAATGSEGLIGAYFEGYLHGPRRGSGTFTSTETRTFTTTP
jgi:hypothetical protein